MKGKVRPQPKQTMTRQQPLCMSTQAQIIRSMAKELNEQSKKEDDNEQN
tara:strand:- start:19234 stop:19380 length:147 start_codon:yes stop_codon:yes gene_type:complete